MSGKYDALRDMTPAVWAALLRACTAREVPARVESGREAAVRAYQAAAAADYPWIGEVDGWPGDRTLCALWRDVRPGFGEVVDRASLAANAGRVAYKMGGPGPGWLDIGFGPFGDCTDFIAYCLGRAKSGGPDWVTADGKWRWLHTGSLVDDATGACELVRAISEPVAPCIAVYPDRGGRQGHAAIVTSVSDRGGLLGVDCSSSSWHRYGTAVRWRNLGFLRRRKGIVWCRPV